ncbi:MAG: InlB B-repeat-containing protein [Mycoplasmataceae bacterium]|nr:InlB B-repeat-containing protein [Mycoplasmataceae bacterium]
MESKSIPVNNTEIDSFLKTQADCSVNQGGYTFYRPINKVTWGNDKINMTCGNSFKTKNISSLRGPSHGYPWNQYLHMYFINGAKAQCENEPILGMKFINDANGKYSIEYICPNDDSMKFSQEKDYQYKDLERSSYSSTERNVTVQNNNFINQDWLQNAQRVYQCPNNWFLSKIGGSTRYENNITYNNYDWTCGTFYNDYKNADGAEFQWRYYKENNDIYIQILTNAKITLLFDDDQLQDFAGTTIFFDIRYNITQNITSVYYKTVFDGYESKYVDGTEECHIVNKGNSIEINYPLTELSIIQITMTKGDFTIFDSDEELNKLPLCFSKMTIIQDTNIPKILNIIYDNTNNPGAVCNNEIQYVKKHTEGTPIGEHPKCFKLGHTATHFIDKATGNNISTDYIVNDNMILIPTFTPNLYTVKFVNNINGLTCTGKTEVLASLNEIISDVPVCSGPGMVFQGWFDNDNKAGVAEIDGDVIYYAKVDYPTYKLTFVTENDVICKDCGNYKMYKAYEEIGKLPEPYKEGGSFVGWYYDTSFANPVKETDKIIKDTFIYPKFDKALINVFYVIPDGATINPNIKFKQVSDGTTLRPLPTCTRSSGTFKGWYRLSESGLGNKWNVLTPVTEETILTAVFDVNGTTVYKNYNDALMSGDLDTTTNSTTGPTTNSTGSTTGSTGSTGSTGPTGSTSGSTGSTTGSTSGSTGSTSGSGSTKLYCAADGVWPRTEANKTYTLSCGTGMSGSMQRICNSNGQWGSITGSCVAGVKYCDVDGIWPKTTAGDIARIVCDNNYSGFRERECDSDGQWGDINSTSCILQCPADDKFPATNAGTKAEIKSNECTITRECGSNGQWGEEKTDCGKSSSINIVLIVLGIIVALLSYFMFNNNIIMTGAGVVMIIVGILLFFIGDKEWMN